MIVKWLFFKGKIVRNYFPISLNSKSEVNTYKNLKEI